GITGVRYSQFAKNVVRVVLTLDAPRTYDVTRSAGQVRISVDAPTQGAQAAPVTARPMDTLLPNTVDGTMVSSRDATSGDKTLTVALAAQQQSQQPRITVTFDA